MKIDAIFTLIPGSLYSVKFAGEPDHEFAKLFRLWNDTVFLELFFEAHYDDLLAYWEYMSVEDAIAITMDEGIILEEEILEVAKAGGEGGFNNLSSMFKPLHSGTSNIDCLEKSKARGFRRRSWLRVYGVRLDVNKYVISGGAIKLTRTMNEKEHMVQELRKLEEVCQFLKADQRSEFGLFELF